MNHFTNSRAPAFLLFGLTVLSCSSEPADGVAGAGGATSAGGMTAMGGSPATAGTFGKGGSSGTGGDRSVGGALVASGGTGLTGGAPNTGGVSGLGGASTESGGTAAVGGADGSGGTSSEETAQIYILFGQSNMWGEPLPEPKDIVENPYVEVLTRISCTSHGEDEWVTAQPPLHECVGEMGGGDNGPGVGPGDYFARKMWSAFPKDKILLIPNAIPGVPISEFAVGSETYNKMIARAQLGQERGEIKGILFHQGESDCGNSSWPHAVKAIVDAMRETLGTGNIPFLAGEIPRASQCQGHNPLVNQLPDLIENAHVISSEGLTITDEYHFGLEEQRTFGTRYGDKMVELLNF